VAIAREAGTSESQLMKHFGSKQGLLVAIFDRGWSAITTRVQASQGGASPARRLLATLQAMAIELEGDSDLKELVMLESHRVRKDNRDVLVSHSFQQFANIVDGLLAEMRDEGQFRSDVNLDAARAALIGMIEGLLRGQVVAKRSEFRADYSFDDVKKVLEVLVTAFGNESVQPLKAVSR
jgi:AcrR family transcriptional regulator